MNKFQAIHGETLEPVAKEDDVEESVAKNELWQHAQFYKDQCVSLNCDLSMRRYNSLHDAVEGFEIKADAIGYILDIKGSLSNIRYDVRFPLNAVVSYVYCSIAENMLSTV